MINIAKSKIVQHKSEVLVGLAVAIFIMIASFVKELFARALVVYGVVDSQVFFLSQTLAILVLGVVFYGIANPKVKHG